MPRAKASLLALAIAAAASAAMFLLPYTPPVPVHTALTGSGEWVRSVEMPGILSIRMEPCVSMMDGKVRKIHVQPGQRVQKGQLLFSMDTDAQETALASVAAMRHAAESLMNTTDERLAAMTAAHEAEWLKTEKELRAQIEAAQIRAGMDGVLERVYVEEGQYTPAASLMGSISGDGQQIIACVPAETVNGMTANETVLLKNNGEWIGTASVRSISVPDEKQMVQITFHPPEQSLPQQYAQGGMIVVEWLAERMDAQALIPVSAVDEQGNIWVIADGRAYARKPDVIRQGGGWIAADAQWHGLRIVLRPQGLSEGCRVKEAKEE